MIFAQTCRSSGIAASRRLGYPETSSVALDIDTAVDLCLREFDIKKEDADREKLANSLARAIWGDGSSGGDGETVVDREGAETW